MDKEIKDKILALLAEHRIMSIATVRKDGWPQVTTVGYASEGLVLYFLCGRESQKAANLARDDRVSLTIDHDTANVMEISGLSMAGRAIRISEPHEGARILELLFSRYPDQPSVPFALPEPGDVALFRVEPAVISVLDYSKGFAHTDQVVVEPGLLTATESQRPIDADAPASG